MGILILCVKVFLHRCFINIRILYLCCYIHKYIVLLTYSNTEKAIYLYDIRLFVSNQCGQV